MEDLQDAEFERRNVIFRDELASRLNILTNFIDDVKASKRAGEREVTRRATTGTSEFGVDYLYEMFERKDLEKLRNVAGVQGLISPKYLDTNLRRGIDSSSIEQRKERFGDNILPQAELMSFFEHMMDALGDTMMLILIGAAVVSLVLGLTVPDPHTGRIEYSTGWIEGAAILISVTVVVLVTAMNNYSKALKFAELSAVTSKRSCNVLRDGYKQMIDSTELVVGDVLFLNAGDLLPADALFIDGVECKCDEAAVTGESEVVDKDADLDPFMIAGTSMVQGMGRAVVTAVGQNSSSGKQLKLTLESGEQETPLQKKLSGLADDIGYMGGLAAALTFVVLSGKELYFWMYLEDHPLHAKPFLDFLIVAVTIVVVAIPEGLPLAVTIALAYSMRDMMEDNCLVRVMAACETMGGADAICSDKTGTLTTNTMTVVQAWVAEKRVVVPGAGIPMPTGGQPLTLRSNSMLIRSNSTVPTNVLDGLNGFVVDQFCEACAMNSTAEEKLQLDGTTEWTGNKTEIGILRFIKERVGVDPVDIQRSFPSESVRQFPFNSEKKRMSTVVRKGNQFVLYVKGAPDLLLAQCSEFMTTGGQRMALSNDKREYLKAVITDMALLGNRCILVGLADLATTAMPHDEPVDNKLCIMSILGIQDPIREEVPGAVQKCQQAGIMVRMVTGDNKQTACSIAEKAGIYHKETGIAMEGLEFRLMAEEDPEKLRSLLPRLEVLARSSPQDKYVLVDLLKKTGNTVAVTGDGTNDAPALKLADVGFAMFTGTEIAKTASDIVLLDDNFVSVVKACMWGRNVNDNIKKFLQFQVTVNIVGVALTFFGAAFSDTNTAPLTPVQLLWLNLIMDTLAALALATEQPSENLLDRHPIPRDSSLITPRMWINIGGHAVFQLGVMLWLMLYAAPHFKVEHESVQHRTVVFNTFIIIQIWNEFNARKLHGEFNVFAGMNRSKGHLKITCIMVLFQYCSVQFFGDFFGTRPLNFAQWMACVAIGAFCIPYGALLNILTRGHEAPKPSPPPPRTSSKNRLMQQQTGKVVQRLKATKALQDGVKAKEKEW
jgi:Ca2+-transporting ATPase